MITISEAIIVDIGHDLVDQGAPMRFFNRASVVGADQTISILAPGGERGRVDRRASGTSRMRANLLSTSATRASAWFQRASSSPATSRLAGVGGVILPEGAVSGVSRRFKIAVKGLARLVPSLSCLLGRSHRCSDCAGSDNAEERFLDRVVDAQAAECDATRFAIVRPAAHAAVARDMMLGAGIAQRQLASTAAATDQTREQGVAMLGRAMMSTRRNIAGDHRADRFEPLPAHIAIVGPRLQREPVGARLAADLHTDALGRVSVATAVLR